MDSVTDVSPRPERTASPPAPAPEPRFFNRELSWLAFNRRVLEEASNPNHPLLERVRFLSISASNLDEFFMVRVAGLKAHQALGVEEQSADGMTVAQQLSAITAEADRLVTSQHEVWGGLQLELLIKRDTTKPARIAPANAATGCWRAKRLNVPIRSSTLRLRRCSAAVSRPSAAV